MKKIYIAPCMEVISEIVNNILAGSNKGTPDIDAKEGNGFFDDEDIDFEDQ